MNTEQTLRVADIQRFCMHDGPGIRTTVFLKGCPLHCAWCHNPETQKKETELLFYQNNCSGCGICAYSCENHAHIFDGQHSIDRTKCRLCTACVASCPNNALELCGNDMTVNELLAVVERDKAFYGTNGGVTVSGGEPLVGGEAVISFLEACKMCGLSTVVETCGYADADMVHKVVPFVDQFLWDIKDTDNKRHKVYTGVSNRKIFKNLSLADTLGAETRLRCIMINGVNTEKTHYHELAKIALSLQHCKGIELLAYHAYSGTKSVFIGKKDNGRTDWIPTEEQLVDALETIQAYGIPVTCNGIRCRAEKNINI